MLMTLTEPSVTIAHRLRTIVDYDKVVVLGAGRLLEAGSACGAV